MTDITAPESVEVQYDIRRGIVWINVDGQCAFRASRIKNLEVTSLETAKLMTREEYEKEYRKSFKSEQLAGIARDKTPSDVVKQEVK